ncbi:hypothetical protein [Pseudopedobacter beijingensis]|uniref:DUF3575 domain-containing protein n=1 Tax=Pseudopedobacter beijingensis TaxID=1207056 RepID=A0ABW4II83_9SPHI
MKGKLLFLMLFLLLSLYGYTQQGAHSEQEKEESTSGNSAESKIPGRNELKFNLFTPIYSAVELNYERILANNTALGVGASYFYETDKTQGLSFDMQWSLNPYYRLYFGKKEATGFFVEANASAAQTRSKDDLYREQNGIWTREATVYYNFGYGLGFAVGAKFLSNKGLIGEVFAGLGRYFNAKDYMTGQYPRLGVLIGKRF